MKTNIYLIIGTLFILMASCSSAEQQKEKKQAITVQTVYPEQTNSYDVTTSGIVKSTDIARLGTRMMGFVEHIYVKKGEKVKKNKLLLSINDQELKAKLAQVEAKKKQAEAAFQLAKKNKKRFTELLASNSISRKEYEEVELHYLSAQAQLQASQQMANEIKANRSYTQIRAPFSGTITNVIGDKGMLATPGQPLLIIERDDQFVIETQVNENTIKKLNLGEQATVKIEATNSVLRAKIAEYSSSSITTGGHYLVTLIPEKEQAKTLLSGMHATIDFKIKNKEETLNSTLYIPTKVLIKKGGLKGVYVISKNGEAVLRWLRLGKENKKENKVEVLAGLSANTQIIIPTIRLSNGLEVISQ